MAYIPTAEAPAINVIIYLSDELFIHQLIEVGIMGTEYLSIFFSVFLSKLNDLPAKSYILVFSIR